MWFNHVIRTEDRNMINSNFLWMFLTRGAMISCPHHQEGVDIVLPVCLKNANLSPDNVTAILIQVKNAKQFKCKIDKTVFDGMDPRRVGLFDRISPMPVIRIVFALASEEPAVLFPPPHERTTHFTSFDIWCAGLLSFKDTRNDFRAYDRLLGRSLQPHDAFDFQDTTDLHLDAVSKASRGCRRRTMAALTMADVGHCWPHVD